ncbi:uncharacterized protein [Ptychodera flava]|uniref:uncharacterized protein isoform X2 n=1 Tax=Ptychodera flava TaxID=63121 RepID=UPI00396A2153
MTDKLASVAEYENVFKGRVHEIAWLYYVSGSDEEITLEQNRNAFKRLRLRPRVLQDVSSIDVSASLLGQRVDIPICIAPTAWQGLAHPDAEVATAKAAEKVGTCMILSLHANKSLEEVREKTPKGLKWLNLYLFPNRTVTLDLVRRTENANYNGLVVTIDNPSLGNLIKFHHRKGISIYSRRVNDYHGNGHLEKYLKIEALPEVVRAIGDRVEVYIDGGIRNGIDVFKALALGAKAVFVGRPILYGLAHSGEDGAKQILEILKSELIRTMRFAGCRSLSDIVPSFVVHESHYAKL